MTNDTHTDTPVADELDAAVTELRNAAYDLGYQNGVNAGIDAAVNHLVDMTRRNRIADHTVGVNTRYRSGWNDALDQLGAALLAVRESAER